MEELNWMRNSNTEQMKMALRLYNLTYQDLAVEMGMTRQSISNWFRTNKIDNSHKIAFWYCMINVFNVCISKIDICYSEMIKTES